MTGNIARHTANEKNTIKSDCERCLNQKWKKQKSLLVLILAVTMTVSSAACVGDISTVGGTVTVPGNGKWVDSSIRGEVTAESEIRLQDDFAAAANKDYFLELAASTDEDVDIGTFEKIQWDVNNQCIELFDDTSIDSKHAVELRKFADLARDYELRISQGVEPLKPYLEAITNITSIPRQIHFGGDGAEKHGY